MVHPTQYAFMHKRNYIVVVVVVLHEMIYELHSQRFEGVIFKLNFQKTRDKVKLPFLQQTSCIKGIAPGWCNFIA